MTVQQFLDGCQTIIGDDSDDFETVLFEALKQVLGKVQLVVKTRGFKKTTTLTLSASAQTVDLSSLDDFQQEIVLYYVDGGQRVDLTKKEDLHFHRLVSETETAPPEFYRIRGQTLEVQNLADKAYSIVMEYLGVEAEGVLKTDTFTYSTGIIEVIRSGVYEIAYGHREEKEHARDHRQDFLAGMEFIKSEYFRQEHPDHVDETED